MRNNLVASREHAALLGACAGPGRAPATHARRRCAIAGADCTALSRRPLGRRHAAGWVRARRAPQQLSCFAGSARDPGRRVQVQGGTTGQLLRERGYIHSSAAQLDDVIGQAQAVRVERRTH